MLSKLACLTTSYLVIVLAISVVNGLPERRRLLRNGNGVNETQHASAHAGVTWHAIPKRLWQTSKSKDLPKPAVAARNTWQRLNPGLHLNILSDADANAFIEQTYGSDVVNMYKGFPLGVMRADFFRYAILYRYGGIYADIDVSCQRPITQWLKQRPDAGPGHLLQQGQDPAWEDCSVIIGLENDVHFCQWTLASVPMHPIFHAVIEEVIDAYKRGFDVTNEHFVHAVTGPGVFTAGIRKLMMDPADVRAGRGMSSGEIFKLVQTNATYYERARRMRACFVDQHFFASNNTCNQFGSTQWAADGSHWTSWRQERDQLLTQQRQAQNGTAAPPPSPSPPAASAASAVAAAVKPASQPATPAGGAVRPVAEVTVTSTAGEEAAAAAMKAAEAAEQARAAAQAAQEAAKKAQDAAEAARQKLGALGVSSQEASAQGGEAAKQAT